MDVAKLSLGHLLVNGSNDLYVIELEVKIVESFENNLRLYKSTAAKKTKSL